MSTRTYDVVLFGATGFTGGLTAAYLARHAPPGLRWALAGRDPAKLERRRAELAGIDASCSGLPLLQVRADDAAGLRTLAESTRIVVTTVGPYIRYGEPLVAACAEAGTDYADLAGEPEFVDRMYVRYHRRAAETGARLIHSCGFESAPIDLGVYLTVGQLPADVPISVDGYLHAVSALSGGSLQTSLIALSRTRELAAVRHERRRLERIPPDREVSSTAGRPVKVRELGVWAMPMPTISRQIIARSALLLDRYGPDFRYRHRTVKHPVPAAALAAALGMVFLAVRIPPLRRWLGRLVEPGRGPGEERRATCWFRLTFVGSGGGRRVRTEVSGGDPGYTEGAKIIAEAALCLATDDLPSCSGQVTPAVALGRAFVERLRAAGIGFATSAPVAFPSSHTPSLARDVPVSETKP